MCKNVVTRVYTTVEYENTNNEQANSLLNHKNMTLIMLGVKTTFGNIVRDQSVSICMLQYKQLMNPSV
jgi:hypothetical protein